ncbi:MAG: hypothetical protein HY589_01095, partial [Candidatus Omnitrophica bacterium]|nr:hypothetical protein [Candidatus Omnitrophota bacterium]
KRRELAAMGGSLGADVPFFLHDANFAVGRGRGDEITCLPTDMIIWHIIISFNFAVRTSGIYKGLNLGLTGPKNDVKMPARCIARNDIESLALYLYNRLEEATLARFGVVRAAKGLLLKEGALGALLSGSGPTVFGIAKTRREAIRIKKRIEKIAGQDRGISVIETRNPALSTIV